ncbi:hypothetical protein M569_03642, partial [Genlisea aurea]
LEEILGYRFKNKELLRESLTHPSCTDHESYERLEYLGDACLSMAISDYLYHRYPEVDPGKLTVVRSANVSTEKLARVAVRHGLYKHIQLSSPSLDKKVEEFAIKVLQENEPMIHGGSVKAPKVLADIVESVAAAIYVDANYDLALMWRVMEHLMEPIITLGMLEGEPQPVTLLFELCQREGKLVDIKYSINGRGTTASIYVDGDHLASSFSEQKEHAKLQAAKIALEILSAEFPNPMEAYNESRWHDGDVEFEGAKQKLSEACVKKKWPKPKNYRIDEVSGSDHMKVFTCSVEIKSRDGSIRTVGAGKNKLKAAENSAASAMVHKLRDS